MVTIEEIKKTGQWGAREHMLEEARNYPYAGRVLRKASPYFTKFFIEHNISANLASFCSILLGFVGNFMFVFGNYYLMLVGCVIYQFWTIFDLVDGEIARVTNIKTLGGQYLEDINGIITTCGLMVCLGIGLSRVFGNNIFIFWGLTFALFVCLSVAFARTRDWRMEQSGRKKKKYVSTKKVSYVKKFYRKSKLPFFIYNGYLILTAIVVFELILPIKLDFSLLGESFSGIFGETFNITSIYFLLFGFNWIIRTVISGIMNYKYLMSD